VSTARRDASATVLRLTDAALTVGPARWWGGSRALLRDGGERGERVDVRWTRYRGQAFEIPLPFSPGFRARFHELHRRRFGFSDPTRAVEAVRLRARVAGPSLPWDAPGAVLRPGAARGARASGRLAGLAGPVPLHRRDELRPGALVEGPAVIAEDGGTTWVPPGARASAHEDGTLRVRELRR
jgi:N-methylhydantoinase A/oxoprolinase/acetone carboxylase beta subunit